MLELVQAIALLDRVAPPRLVEAALRKAGIDRMALAAGPGLLPYEVEAVIVDTVSRGLGDRHLGARLAREFDYAAYGAYARYVTGAPDLGTALRRARAAFPLLHSGSELVLREAGRHLLIGRASRLAHCPGRRHLDEGAALLICQAVRHFLGRGWRPDRVELAAQDRACIDGFEAIVGAPVLGGAEMPAVAVRRRDLGAPNPSPPPARAVVTRGELPALMGVAEPPGLADAVRGVLQAQLALGDVSEDSVALRLGLGPRTLQRGLRAEGTGFREIRSRVVEARARALLSETALGIDEIAGSLGYAEPNSFRRAFRRWTGVAPSAYRGLKGAGARSSPGP